MGTNTTVMASVGAEKGLYVCALCIHLYTVPQRDRQKHQDHAVHASTC